MDGGFTLVIGRRYWLLHILLFVLFLSLLLSAVPDLLASGMNNLASRVLVSEWRVVSQKVGIPRCGEDGFESKSEPYTQAALFFRPDNIGSLVNSGRSAWLKGDCSSAETNWKHVLEMTPENQVVVFWMYWVSGGNANRLTEALSPELMADYTYRTGERVHNEGNVEAALEWYELSMDLKPSRRVASKIAYLYRQAECVEKAMAVWQRLATVLPEEHADHWWALGQVAELDRRWEEAARVYGIGSEIAEEPYDFWVRQGYALRRLERWEKAEETYRQALAVDPGNFWPYMYLGYVQSKQGNYEAARSWYELAWKLAPDDFNPMYHLGVTSFRQERYVEAKKWLEAASEVLPDNLWCIYYLAQTSYHLEEFVRAENFLSQAVSLHPGMPWEWAVQLGDWRLALGEQQGALDMYQQALIWRPNEEIIQNRIEVLQKR